jgi:hypothetical protein
MDVGIFQDVGAIGRRYTDVKIEVTAWTIWTGGC